MPIHIWPKWWEIWRKNVFKCQEIPSFHCFQSLVPPACMVILTDFTWTLQLRIMQSLDISWTSVRCKLLHAFQEKLVHPQLQFHIPWYNKVLKEISANLYEIKFSCCIFSSIPYHVHAHMKLIFSYEYPQVSSFIQACYDYNRGFF